MKQFDVKGMTCAACSSRVEKAVSSVDGVTSCSVSLLTDSMSVDGDFSEKSVIAAVKKAGYSAAVKEKSEENSEKSRKESDTPSSEAGVIRLIISVILLVILMYFSMGHNMAGLPVPFFLEGNFMGLSIIQMLLSLSVMIINKKFFINGVKAIMHKAPNMDTLVAMGSGVSFGYSLVLLFYMTFLYSSGNISQAEGILHEYYFEAAAMIVTLISVGKRLEARSKGKTTDALKALMRLAPDKAVIIIDEKEITVSVADIAVGDIFVIRSGDSIPADGVIISGSGSVDESALTGESIPVDKAAGDKVSAGTINKSGFMKCRTTGVGKDTMLSGIIKLVSDAAASKAPVAKAADRVAGVFVPAVLGISVITTLVWLILGQDAGYALARGISVLVVSCPCALGLATPVAIMVGSGIGAEKGILFKTAASLEHIGKVKIVVLDKTGTITNGKPSVTDIIPCDGISEDRLLEYAYSLEYMSEHPLGRAVCERAEQLGIKKYDADNVKVFPGNGLAAEIMNTDVSGGSLSYISKSVTLSDDIKKIAEKLASDGKTPLLFTSGGEYAGMLAVADTVREDSIKAISDMKKLGLYVVMLTGDNKLTAEAIGRTAGVDKVIAGVLPEGKQTCIARLQENGMTAMIGDGINDAPALMKADVGVAIGAGTDVAIDAADIVLVNSRLSDAVRAIRLGRSVLFNIYENLFWAFGYNIIGIPLAAGVFTSILGWSLNPMFGAAAMSVSSFLVVSNALRLKLKNIDSPVKNRKIKAITIKEADIMKKTIKIEGMMCKHCEAAVKKLLEGTDGVISAEVSHENGTAVIELSHDVSDELLTKLITDRDYKVISIG